MCRRRRYRSGLIDRSRRTRRPDQAVRAVRVASRSRKQARLSTIAAASTVRAERMIAVIGHLRMTVVSGWGRRARSDIHESDGHGALGAPEDCGGGGRPEAAVEFDQADPLSGEMLSDPLG